MPGSTAARSRTQPSPPTSASSTSRAGRRRAPRRRWPQRATRPRGGRWLVRPSAVIADIAISGVRPGPGTADRDALSGACRRSRRSRVHDCGGQSASPAGLGDRSTFRGVSSEGAQFDEGLRRRRRGGTCSRRSTSGAARESATSSAVTRGARTLGDAPPALPSRAAGGRPRWGLGQVSGYRRNLIHGPVTGRRGRPSSGLGGFCPSTATLYSRSEGTTVPSANTK